MWNYLFFFFPEPQQQLHIAPPESMGVFQNAHRKWNQKVSLYQCKIFEIMGLALWHSGVSHHCDTTTGMLVQVLVIPLLIQLPAN